MSCGTPRRMKTRDKQIVACTITRRTQPNGPQNVPCRGEQAVDLPCKIRTGLSSRCGRPTDYGRSETDGGLYVTLQDPRCISSGPGLLRYKTYLPTYAWDTEMLRQGLAGRMQGRLFASSSRRRALRAGLACLCRPSSPNPPTCQPLEFLSCGCLDVRANVSVSRGNASALTVLPCTGRSRRSFHSLLSVRTCICRAPTPSDLSNRSAFPFLSFKYG